MLRRSGPHLALKAPENFFSIFAGGGEGGFSLLPLVGILKMLSISWVIQICMKNMKTFLTPDPSHPPGGWDQTPPPTGVAFFF